MMKIQRKASLGMHLVQTLGIILISLMVSALGIDFSYYFAEQNRLQTVADSAALAAVSELYRGIAVDPDERLDDARSAAREFVSYNAPGLNLNDDDIRFGFVDPATKKYNSATFTTPSPSPDYAITKGYNAVFVRMDRSRGGTNSPLNSLMASLFGVNTMDTSAHSVAMIDQTVNAISNGGLRPIYACEGQVKKAMEDGILENNTVRVYGDHLEVDGVGNFANCPLPGSGNWGFADFTNCGPGTVGASTIEDWFASGYPGTVQIGTCYSTKPGNFISSISSTLDRLIANRTVFPIPFYNTWSGNGSNTQVNISGFVGFRMTGYKGNGSAASRYMEGHFTRYVCNKGCTSDSSRFSTIGGAAVKLRLASQS